MNKHIVTEFKTPFRRKFSHQTKHFCCSSAFFFNMTTPCWLAPERSLLKPQPSFQLCKLANPKACESGDYANANASTSECVLQQPLPNSD